MKAGTSRLLGATALLAAVLLGAGCGAPDLGPSDEPAAATAGASAAQQARPSTSSNDASSPAEQRHDLESSAGAAGAGPSKGTRAVAGVDLGDAAAGLSGRNGMAVAVPGGRPPAVSGDWSSGVAWSTIKVPLAVAAVRADGGRPSSAVSALITRAITQSDNAAAEALWQRLGEGAAAGKAVRAVLRDGGDPRTQVQTARVRPPFTAFGQTQWPLSAQASFAARLPCVRGAAPVLDLMGRITGGQRWGLGSLGSSARFKGGWGPGPGGGYLVRQLGVVSVPGGGHVGVALASEPADGSFETAKANLTQMSGRLARQLATLKGGRC